MLNIQYRKTHNSAAEVQWDMRGYFTHVNFNTIDEIGVAFFRL